MHEYMYQIEEKWKCRKLTETSDEVLNGVNVGVYDYSCDLDRNKCNDGIKELLALLARNGAVIDKKENSFIITKDMLKRLATRRINRIMDYIRTSSPEFAYEEIKYGLDTGDSIPYSFVVWRNGLMPVSLDQWLFDTHCVAEKKYYVINAFDVHV